MLEKFLRDVVSIVVGKNAEEIAELLNTKKHVNEFNIAKKLDITINQTRNILYKLSDFGLVSSIRKKDKKKGWYTYFWRIEIIKALEFLKEIKLKQINQINYQINNRETKQFYVCNTCNIEASEENALLQEFTCNECGEIFTLKDDTKLLKELKKNSDKIEKDISFIDEELAKENVKIDKIKEKEAKKEAKIKKEAREAKKKLRDKEKKKEAKKKGVKKKVVKKTAKKATKKKKPTKKKVVKKKSVKKKVVKKKAAKKKK